VSQPPHPAESLIAPSVVHGWLPAPVPEVVHQLLATDVAIQKLSARGISALEAGQLPSNRHVMVRNPTAGSERGKRRLLIGRTDGDRALTLVIERTIDPTAWLIVTGWGSTNTERKLLGG
jgi:hypothetical protein